MMKARLNDGTVLLGLVDRNLELLREGKKMYVDLERLGLPGLHIVIGWAPTERDFLTQLHASGLIDHRTYIQPLPEEG